MRPMSPELSPKKKKNKTKTSHPLVKHLLLFTGQEVSLSVFTTCSKGQLQPHTNSYFCTPAALCGRLILNKNFHLSLLPVFTINVFKCAEKLVEPCNEHPTSCVVDIRPTFVCITDLAHLHLLSLLPAVTYLSVPPPSCQSASELVHSHSQRRSDLEQQLLRWFRATRVLNSNRLW